MMSIAETQLLQDLKRRVEALEVQRRSESAPQQPQPLARRNAQRQADVARLRKAMAAVLAAHPRPDDLTAKKIGKALERVGFAPLPAERTLRLHLAAIRGNGNTAVMPSERNTRG